MKITCQSNILPDTDLSLRRLHKAMRKCIIWFPMLFEQRHNTTCVHNHKKSTLTSQKDIPIHGIVASRPHQQVSNSSPTGHYISCSSTQTCSSRSGCILTLCCVHVPSLTFFTLTPEGLFFFSKSLASETKTRLVVQYVLFHYIPTYDINR